MAAWVLNLDADLELGARAAGARSYSPTRPVRLGMRPHVERLRATLLAAGDLVVDDGGGDDERVPSVRGQRGRAFCPTPRAIALLRRAGAVPDPHPPLSVLLRVNSRAFASSLGGTLPGAAFVTDGATALAMLRGAPEVAQAWRVKHPFGMAGRNQRVIAAGSPDERDRDFVRRGVARGGVQVEPDVEIVEEYGIHGVLGADGSLQLGALVRQRCDAHGAWLATERADAGPAAAEVSGAVREEAGRVGRALAAAGYQGPFGVDAFTYRGGGGAVCLQPRSEINARYSMGFAIGFGAPP